MVVFLPDAQRAIRIIRSRAPEWNIQPDRVGVMGSSAGGEIAALAETKFDAVELKPSDPIDSLNSRPAAVAAYYSKLKAQGIQAEVHIYAKGGHGFGMTGRTPAFHELPVSHWPEQLPAWLAGRGLLAP